MTAADVILSSAIWLAFVILGIAFLMTVWRVIKGPTLADRVVALDMLTGIVIGFIALIAIRTGFTLYIDIAISLGLVGFLATVAFARFILSDGDGGKAPKPDIARALLTPPPGPRRKQAGRRSAGSRPAVRRKAGK
ncbi:cation:proton antiporter [Rhizobium terrae]|uniref:cation:proton antiporter n=1 Tax=Rhizobium terrae TaxID=2171756 RepID=UPI000E3BA1F0|nr:cation:proton antiporter [Rhizobium terrae]